MSDEFRAEQFYPDEDYEEEEDDSNCGAFGQILVITVKHKTEVSRIEPGEIHDTENQEKRRCE